MTAEVTIGPRPATATAGERVTLARCASCGVLVYRKRLARNLHVCPECGFHRRLTATERVRQLADE